MKKAILSIISIVALSASALAQIPNAGFESFTTVGSYEVPNGWGTMNNTTATFSVYTATKGTPGSPGASYLKLTSKTVSASVVNGIAVSGVLSSSSKSPKNGSYIYLDNLQFSGSVIGISEQSKNQDEIILYPNPTTESFTMELKNNVDVAEINVYDIIGKQVFRASFSNSETVNTMGWARGTYFVKMSRNNKSSINKKIIIQ